jgi:uncharacterized protein (UPF0333 family)
MRGNVYRLGRRRAGSIVLATGIALAFAVTGQSSAAAKTSLRAANSAKTPLRAANHQAKVQTRPSVVARAAGHKIA